MRPVYLLSKTPYPGVIHLPVLTIRFLSPAIDVHRYGGFVLTSKQAIEALRSYPVSWESIRCVCVSEATAEAARKAGALHVVSGSGYGVSIPALLEKEERSIRWLYPRPREVASDWADVARAGGIDVEEAVVYETVCNPDAAYDTVSAEGVLVFTSPSAIRCFLSRREILPTHLVVVIGKTTQAALPAGIDSRISEEPSVASAVGLAFEIARKT